MFRFLRGLIRLIFGLIILAIIGSFVHAYLVPASLERDWTLDQKILADVAFHSDGTASIRNVRNIDYRSTSDYTPQYYDAIYDPKEIIRAWLLVEPFGSFGAAHTMLSFEFSDGRFLAISAEIRKEVGESFSPVKGLLRNYELVYVIADERDVVRLRTNYRKDTVRLYPVRADITKVQDVFRDMLLRSQKLTREPEMYHTLVNNCTTNIARHARAFSDRPIPWWDHRYLFPATVDELAYELGMIDTDLSLEEARIRFDITTRGQANDANPNFSRAIREVGTTTPVIAPERSATTSTTTI
jgi:hypothetical protein